VAETDGEATFHVASNPRESGLIPAEALRPLWRNLQEKARRPMSGIRLDALLSAESSPRINWLVIDCLPAAALLRGALQLLDQCDVVLARVALLAEKLPALIPESGLNDLRDLLSEHDFKSISQDEERMPLLAAALFVRLPGRGWRASAVTLEEAQAKIAELSAEKFGFREALAQSDAVNSDLQLVRDNLRAEIEALRAELAAKEATACEEAIQRECLASEAEGLNRRLSDHLIECAHLRNEVSEATAKLIQLQAHVEELNQQNQRLETLAVERLQQINVLEDRGTLREDELLRQRKECEELRAMLIDRQAQTDQIEQARLAAEALVSSTHNHAHQLAIECDKLNERIQSQTIKLAEKDGQVARISLELANQSAQLQEYRGQAKLASDARRHFDIEIA
jgi:hypothetical protein